MESIRFRLIKLKIYASISMKLGRFAYPDEFMDALEDYMGQESQY